MRSKWAVVSIYLSHSITRFYWYRVTLLRTWMRTPLPAHYLTRGTTHYARYDSSYDMRICTHYWTRHNTRQVTRHTIHRTPYTVHRTPYTTHDTSYIKHDISHTTRTRVKKNKKKQIYNAMTTRWGLDEDWMRTGWEPEQIEMTEENGTTHKPHVGPWLLGQCAVSLYFSPLPGIHRIFFFSWFFWLPIVSGCFARTVAPVASVNAVSVCSIFAPSCHD